MSSDNPLKTRKKVVRRKLNPPPPISSVTELIELAQSGKRYSNIDMEMLWRILPQLIELDVMIGMSDLKQTIFYQIIFYLQNLFINSEHDYLHTVILGPPGTGKCLGKDTPILMYDGRIVSAKHIRPGDKLMGDDSTCRNVLSICQGTEQMYTIQEKYRVNASHVISLVHKDKDDFMDISVASYLKDREMYKDYTMYHTSVVFNKCKIPDIDPYIAGYCMFGAYMIDETDTYYVDATEGDIRAYLLSTKLLQVYSDTILEINKGPLHDLVTENTIHHDYKINKPHVLRFFLGGLYDSIGKEYNVYLLPDKHRIDDVIFIHNVLGINYTLNKKNIRTVISPPGIPQLVDYQVISVVDKWMIPSFKYRTVHRVLNPSSTQRFITRKPVQITKDTVDDYYGFELDGNGRFLLKDCLVTHNTSIAKVIGEIYREMGILSPHGIFRVAKREDFVAEYLGQTAIKTKKLLTSCLGGVLFIDEVYALGPGERDSDSFSKEAIDTLNVFLSEHNSSFCCIIAGYEDDVKRCFFSVNQGLERRFQWVHRIESYTPEELANIFFKIVGDIGWQTNITQSLLVRLLKKHQHCFKSYGGDIEKLISKCKMCHARRIFSEHNPNKFTLTNSDLEEGLTMMEPNTLTTNTPPRSHFSMYM